MSASLDLGPGSFVVEIASNDGYLLRNFIEAGVPCLGVEPAANVAAKAMEAGVPTDVRFFGVDAARDIRARRGPADLIVANNVLAHVPDINDFVGGLAILVGDRGVVSIEAPHLVRLVESVQFDTIYHEHYAYWSLLAAERVLAGHGLAVFDVERLGTHGGSLRILAAAACSGRPAGPGLADVRAEEERLGVAGRAFYAGFEPAVQAVLSGFRRYLADARGAGRRVVGYGAAAKGNTFLNACGITAEEVTLVGDASPAKQGRLLPGSRIPIVSPDALLAARPDDVVILPWNLAAEITGQLQAIRAWGGRFVTAIPSVQVHEPPPC
jgi:hypothetical protein